jgi:hypothetical protein
MVLLITHTSVVFTMENKAFKLSDFTSLMSLPNALKQVISTCNRYLLTFNKNK